MDSRRRWVVSLREAADCPVEMIGGKAAKLAKARTAGLVVPDGFCVTTAAYEEFLDHARLAKYVAMELGRKPLEEMRWEEIWDAALRIRSEFLHADIPQQVADDIRGELRGLNAETVAVRSSALGEDSAGMSFAGLHESIVGIVGEQSVLDAVRLVWASLFSDAALLYRKELSLDPMRSRMAVLVQEVVVEDRSGVAFGRDPRDLRSDRAIVEAVPGQCALLVDGTVDPDRWILRRSTGEVVQWRPGVRDGSEASPLLEPTDVGGVFGLLGRVEGLFGWPPDMEWTGRSDHVTLLQARPITTAEPDEDEKRTWYLTLSPGKKRLRDLAHKVSEQLIPELQEEGRRFASEEIDGYSDLELADAIDGRLESCRKWKKVYWDEFIPFAHGVRQLAQYYNDAVCPDDPYEFVGLLKGQDMLASRRNSALRTLAGKLRENPILKARVSELVGHEDKPSRTDRSRNMGSLVDVSGGSDFLEEFQRLMREFMDITVGSKRLIDQAELILPSLLEMADSELPSTDDETDADTSDVEQLESRLFNAVGEDRREEAAEVLKIGRLSWRLRDDDNLLVSRLQSQLYRAAALGIERLRASGRLSSAGDISEEAAILVVDALRTPSQTSLKLPSKKPAEQELSDDTSTKPRQIVGQPASPGVATGKIRKITGPESFAGFRAGEVLLCDAIQPMMTHLVPLAAAVIERRGGMLIHGAIIARELGIPCANGVVDAMSLLRDGDLVTVDGHFGIITVGPVEFDLELKVRTDGKK